MSKEAMKLALEALEFEAKAWKIPPTPTLKAITALREALAEQPAQQYPEHVITMALKLTGDINDNG